MIGVGGILGEKHEVEERTLLLFSFVHGKDLEPLGSLREGEFWVEGRK